MLEQIEKVIKEYMNKDDLTITEETTFASLDLDSLESVELVMKIEEELDTTIDMNGEVNSIGDVLALVSANN
ncbi:MAG: acyl carrier protein [Propionibacteriaceae bacterium]|nr:acyl carrier protein [Propionibacteriaceae bacterium]